MKIRSVTINQFRGVKSGTVAFADQTLLVGDNNIGKTTILEALDLVLGPERISGPDAICEHDFYQSRYRMASEEDDGEVYPEIRIEVILHELTDQEATRFRNHLEPWSVESDAVQHGPNPGLQPAAMVLRVGFRGVYDPDEDEFRASTFFHSPLKETAEEGEFQHYEFTKKHKRQIGFIYLRSLRTGRRAASLQRSSLLDILLRLRNARPRFWEEVLTNLDALGKESSGSTEFRNILDELQKHLGRYLPYQGENPFRGRLHVGRLTRKDLRNQMAYFLETAVHPESDHGVPYDLFGGGTANILVLALLSAIAKEYKQNVIFVMEEPEIAVPPHTQRRIVHELSEIANQLILTSHSPYVAEQFLSKEIIVLRALSDENGSSFSIHSVTDTEIKFKTLQSNFRLTYAEGLLSPAVFIVEGPTDFLAIRECDRKIADRSSGSYLPLDLRGVVLIEAEGAQIKNVCKFFFDLGSRVFAMCDIDKKKQDPMQEMEAATHCLFLHERGLETPVAEELPVAKIQSFGKAIEPKAKDFGLPLPGDDESDGAWRNWLKQVLSNKKGKRDRLVQQLLEPIAVADLPQTLVGHLFSLQTEFSGRLSRKDPLFSDWGEIHGEYFDPDDATDDFAHKSE